MKRLQRTHLAHCTSVGPLPAPLSRQSLGRPGRELHPLSGRSFRELREEIFRLHAVGEYADALTLLLREAVHFPDQWSETLYWQGCLSALTGDVRGALRCLQEAVERDHWWSEATLRGDSDLKVLQGDPQFETLVSVCQWRYTQAEAAARPDLIVLTPTKDPPWPLLIALHGAGGTAEEFAQHLRPATTEGWLVGVPQSSQVVAPGGYGWADRDRTAREVRGHYEMMVRDYPVDPSRVVLAGFSQGGTAAVFIGLSGLVRARGILGVACAPQDLNDVQKAVRDTSVRQMRLYLLVGDKDHLFKRVTDFGEVLKSAGMAVQLEVRPALGHELPDDFNLSLATALEFLSR